MSDGNVYGFDSPEAFYQYTRKAGLADKARRSAPERDYTGPANVVPTNTDSVYVRVVGPMVARTDDRRCVYPAEFYVRNLQARTDDPVNDWLSMEALGRRDDNRCVAVSPNGEVLKKNYFYGGRAYGTWNIVDPDGESEGDEIQVTAVLVDVADAVAMVRVNSSSNSGFGYDSYVQQPRSIGSSEVEDGERIWVRNYGPGRPVTGTVPAAVFVTRFPADTAEGRAVYAIVSNTADCDDLVLNKRDCVAVTGDVITSAVWDNGRGGWAFGSKVGTGDGLADVTVVEDDNNVLRVKVHGSTQTWYLNPTGKCGQDGSREFKGKYKPTVLEPDPADEVIGSGGPDPYCAAQTIVVYLKCTSCTLTCGDFGPFPPTMCVTTPAIGGSPDTNPDPQRTCSFYFNVSFSPVTVVYRATAVLSGTYTTTFLPSSGMRLSWVGTGKMTHPYWGVFDYGVEVWFADEGCQPNITYTLPFVQYGMLFGAISWYLTYRSFTLPFGTPTAYPELPPAGTFPITVPAAALLPVQVSQDNSGANEDPCPHGIPYPNDYPTLARWSTGAEGFTLSLGPATVTAGGCSDGPGGGTADPDAPTVCDAPACTNGATESYTFPLSGGTGDFTGANGNWTVTHTVGNLWVGVFGAWTVVVDAAAVSATFNGPGGAQFVYVGFGAFGCCNPTTLGALSSSTGTGTVPGGFTGVVLTPVGNCTGCV